MLSLLDDRQAEAARLEAAGNAAAASKARAIEENTIRIARAMLPQAPELPAPAPAATSSASPAPTPQLPSPTPMPTVAPTNAPATASARPSTPRPTVTPTKTPTPTATPTRTPTPTLAPTGSPMLVTFNGLREELRCDAGIQRMRTTDDSCGRLPCVYGRRRDVSPFGVIPRESDDHALPHASGRLDPLEGDSHDDREGSDCYKCPTSSS